MARLLLLAFIHAAAAKKHHKNNTELTIAFTSDLHGEIAPLKHASAIYASLPEPKLLVDSGDSYIGTGYFRRAGPAGMGRVMRALGYAVLAVASQCLDHWIASKFRDESRTAPVTRPEKISANLSMLLASIIYSSLSLGLWTAWGQTGESIALLLLCGRQRSQLLILLHFFHFLSFFYLVWRLLGGEKQVFAFHPAPVLAARVSPRQM